MTTNSNTGGSLWTQAVHWVLCEHEGRLDEAARAELRCWLGISSAHRAAYEEASRLWLLTGLVPPQGAVDEPELSA
ncbi:MAG: FecR/PupR family sigma factor regulator [Rhodocyclaceae bacterium]